MDLALRSLTSSAVALTTSQALNQTAGTCHTYGPNEQHPGYVFGRYVFRPFLDQMSLYSSRFLNVAVWGVQILDAKLTNLVSFIPGASAQSVQSDSAGKEVAIVQSELRVTKVLVAIGVDPANYVQLIQHFSPDQKVLMVQDEALNRNFQRFHQIIIGLTRYVAEQSATYQVYKEEAIRSCQTLKYLEGDLDNILADLQQLGKGARLSPTCDRKYVLTIPTFDKQFKPLRKRSFQEITTYTISPAKREQIPLLIDEDQVRAIDDLCVNSNYVEKAIIIYLTNMGGMLQAFDVGENSEFSYEQFRSLFSNETMEIFGAQVASMQRNIEAGITTAEEIVGNFVERQHEEARRSIFRKIHQIYRLHSTMINRGTHEISLLDEENGLVRSWEVIHKGYVRNSVSFKFRVGEPDPKRDEL